MAELIDAVVTEVSRGDTVIRYASTSRQTAVLNGLGPYLVGAKGKWELRIFNKSLTQKEFDDIRAHYFENSMGELMAADAEDMLEASALEAQAALPSVEEPQDGTSE